MSSGDAILPIGIAFSIAARSAGLPSAEAVMSVSTQPGATELTRMPRGPSSAASDFVYEMKAPFEAEYAA